MITVPSTVDSKLTSKVREALKSGQGAARPISQEEHGTECSSAKKRLWQELHTAD